MKRLQIITSPNCNNNCIFCIDNRRRGKLSAAILTRDGAGAMKKMSGKLDKILFTAGEPTLNKELPKLIGLAKKLRYSEIGLITNGRLMSGKNFCQKLFDAGLNEINVSFHSSRKAIQEKLTGAKNSFDETFAGLKNLDHFKKSHYFNLYVNFTVTKINLKDIGNFIAMLSSFKIDGIVFNVVIPKGRALVNFDKVVPSYLSVSRELKKALKPLKKTRYSISVLGLPLCLMKGIEKFSGNFEKIMTKNPGFNKNIKSVAPWGRKIKAAGCGQCVFNGVCEGVWASYIKKRGWREFKPVLKNNG